MTEKAYIVGYARSPFTLANKGALAGTRPDDIAAQVIAHLLKSTKIDPSTIEDLIMGCAFPEGEQGYNIGRMVALLAGLPDTVSGCTINRWCGSSMEAIHMAAGKIAIGAGDAFICAGVESMSRIPMGGFNPMPNVALHEKLPEAYCTMGETAENVANKYNISRKAQEEFALKSHQKAAAADLATEIVPITTASGEVVAVDGCIRADSTLEKMATLNPAFDAKGSVTAATSSPLTDGASAVIVCSEHYVKQHGLTPLARIVVSSTAGIPPEVMGMGPLDATLKVLARAGLSINDIDLMEINEAFAAQSIPCISELKIDPDRVNLDGGAIALGHPLGASGARITGKAAQLLHRNNKKYAVAAMCIGGGMGIATLLARD